MAEVIGRLRETMPQFHGSESEPKNWKSQWEVLGFLQSKLAPGVRSLETGCGYSTVVAAASGASHTTVTPSHDEVERVRRYCAESNFDSSNLSFEIGPSFKVLAAGGDPLDLVYVDGAHGFPHPCVDWMLTEQRLKVGGLMLVDDIRIPACRMLHDFLVAEPNWRFVKFIGDTSIFEKTAEGRNNADWMHQGINRSYPDYSFMPVASRIFSTGRHYAERTIAFLGLTKLVKKLLGIRE